MKSDRQRRKIACDVLDRQNKKRQRNTFITQKETLRIQTQRVPRKSERARMN